MAVIYLCVRRYLDALATHHSDRSRCSREFHTRRTLPGTCRIAAWLSTESESVVSFDWVLNSSVLGQYATVVVLVNAWIMEFFCECEFHNNEEPSRAHLNYGYFQLWQRTTDSICFYWLWEADFEEHWKLCPTPEQNDGLTRLLVLQTWCRIRSFDSGIYPLSCHIICAQRYEICVALLCVPALTHSPAYTSAMPFLCRLFTGLSLSLTLVESAGLLLLLYLQPFE